MSFRAGHATSVSGCATCVYALRFGLPLPHIYNRFVLVSEFDYHLPEELIAREPLADRAASRLLHLDRANGHFSDRSFRDFPDLLRADDLLVFNNTRVFPARLFGHRGGLHAQHVSPRNPAAREFLHGKVEVLLTRQLSTDPQEWEVLVRPGRKIDVGEHLFFGSKDELRAEVIARGEFGERHIRFEPVADFFDAVERVGHVPLPPYMGREDRPEDRARYQTVYARERGSVAAPTAGLHFTPDVLDRIHARGIETAELTLHVGLGTFQPVHVDVVEDHKIHREWYRIPDEAAKQINAALAAGRRIVAVGTTTVRTLEHAAGRFLGESADSSSAASQSAAALQSIAGGVVAGSAEADLFIYPGFRFRVVGAMLTNFHLPKSTLLMLVSAFAGREHILAAYDHAVRERYRFFSYGDCMYIG